MKSKFAIGCMSALCALTVPAVADGDQGATSNEIDDMAWEQNSLPIRSLLFSGTNIITPLYVSYGQRFPASINKGGKISCATYGAGVSWTHVSSEEKYIALWTADYRRSDYHFSSSAPYGNKLFEHLDSFNVFTWQEYVFDKDNGRAVAGFLSGSLESEDTTSLKNGSSCAGGVGAKQYFSRETSLFLGVGTAYSRLRERWQVIPVLVFDCDLRKDLNLRLGNGAKITWDTFGDKVFLLSAEVSYGAETLTVGHGEHWQGQTLPVRFTGQWNITKEFFVALGVGTIAWSEYRYWENGSKKHERFHTDPSLELTLQAGFKF